MTNDEPHGTLALQTIVVPADANANSDILGALMIAQMDLDSTMRAMTFHRPVRIGDLVLIHAARGREGTISRTIDTQGWITRQPQGRRVKRAPT